MSGQKTVLNELYWTSYFAFIKKHETPASLTTKYKLNVAKKFICVNIAYFFKVFFASHLIVKASKLKTKLQF